MATRASVILPPKALPSTMSWTSGKTMDAIISAGERKKRRSSRSMMAIMRMVLRLSSLAAEQHAGVRECLHLLIAQAASGVMHEYVVERSVLHGERFDLHVFRYRH